MVVGMKSAVNSKYEAAMRGGRIAIADGFFPVVQDALKLRLC